MRLPDLARAAASALWRQKARTLLTLSGVAVGATALVVSFSLGLGLRALTEREFFQRAEFWHVAVYPGAKGLAEEEIPPAAIEVPAGVGPERRERVRQALIAKYRNEHPPKETQRLTADRVKWLASLPDVEAVYTIRMDHGRVALGERQLGGMVFAGRLDPFDPRSRLMAGRLPAADDADEALVTEFLLFQLGIVTDEEIAAAVGAEVRVTVGYTGSKGSAVLSLLAGPGGRPQNLTRSQEELLEKVASKLPAAVDQMDLTAAERLALAPLLATRPKTPEDQRPWNSAASASATLRVCGVLRNLTEEEEKQARRLTMWWQLPDVFLPPVRGERLFGLLPWVPDQGYPAVVVKVRGGGRIEELVEAVTAQGFQENSAVEYLQHARREVTLIAAGLTVFALLALGVAAIGITNTMVTGVVERTREIGVLKAVGARDGQVLQLFLAEGAAIGVMGGLSGYGIARALAGPLDRLCLRLVQEQAKTTLVSESVFAFPWWLGAGAVGLVLVVTILAALYPALRAARIQPVEAVRHE
jgi:putative ABC transport system permease protein